MQDMAYAVAMIAAAILVYFGARLCRRPDTRTKGVLMIVMAAVLVGNVLVWTIPAPSADQAAPAK
jgi:energy-converting hydrogenase Eha subunit B